MSATVLKSPPNSLYDEDFYAWTQEQARLLRERRFDDLDLENLAEEVASLGRSDKDQIESRLIVLLGHLLKWKYQPGQRSPGWRGTIREQRRRIARVLDSSPSLRADPAEIFDEQYLGARLLASDDTGIAFDLLPEQSPFTLDEALDMNFLPGEPDRGAGKS